MPATPETIESANHAMITEEPPRRQDAKKFWEEYGRSKLRSESVPQGLGESWRPWRLGGLFCLAVATVIVAGCGEPAPQEVVVYTALDEEFSKPIFDAFTRQTGIEVRARFDTESTKTVGLAEAIRAERDRPRCDLFWNNEAL
ncbi:MAG: hypothetical protein AAGF31_13675, partial [Planctomycetota bacterium]